MSCRGFMWFNPLGWCYCARPRCGQPLWEHTHEELAAPSVNGGPPFRIRPLNEVLLKMVRNRWGRHSYEDPLGRLVDAEVEAGVRDLDGRFTDEWDD